MQGKNLEQDTSRSVSEEASERTESADSLAIDVFPTSYSKIQFSSQLTNALVQHDLDTLSEIVKTNQKQQIEAQQQQHELSLLTIRNQQEIAIKEEERKLRNDRAESNLIYTGVISFVIIFISVLLYSERVDDKALPSTIFTAAMSAVAGGGVVLAKGKKGKDDEKNPN